MNSFTSHRGPAWMAFTKDQNEDEAAARFLERHGRPPEYIREAVGSILLVGPIPEEEPPQLELELD